MAGSIVCKCGPAFTQNLFTVLGILLVLGLVLRFFSKSFLPELWDKINVYGNRAVDAVGLGGDQQAHDNQQSTGEQEDPNGQEVLQVSEEQMHQEGFY
jgi:hypothetical protein